MDVRFKNMPVDKQQNGETDASMELAMGGRVLVKEIDASLRAKDPSKYMKKHFPYKTGNVDPDRLTKAQCAEMTVFIGVLATFVTGAAIVYGDMLTETIRHLQ